MDNVVGIGNAKEATIESGESRPGRTSGFVRSYRGLRRSGRLARFGCA